MFGAIAKTYYAKVLGVEPERLFVVSVMPCTAKKAECALPSMVGEDGTPDVALFTQPWGLAIDSEGIIYVGDKDNLCVRQLSIE